MAALYGGTARARLGPAAAVIDRERNRVAACEENRLTRAREAPTAGPPALALAEALRYLGRDSTDLVHVASVDPDGDVAPHRAHAEYAVAASGFGDAVVLVCDAEVSAWRARPSAEGPRLDRLPGDFDAFRIAPRYAELTARLGLRPRRDEHLVEAMARAGHEDAAPTQHRLGDELLRLLDQVRSLTDCDHLCLSGGLFFNTYFTTLAATSGIFAHVSIPPHPGRNGAALGAALFAMKARGVKPPPAAELGSPYLGPGYSDAEIKEALESCKLSFDLMHETRMFTRVLQALSRGRLVGWYHGRLEWGPRALGHRSVLADAFAPYVLENLNGFLKRRPAYRTYGVSVPLRDLDSYFEVPSPASASLHQAQRASAPLAAPFMQFEFRPRDPDKFRPLLPPGVHTLRVHTVDEREPRFLRLLELWGEASGTPILVNTSFNSFHEPLVCSPHDAIRVFYGTGLDALAIENFWLQK